MEFKTKNVHQVLPPLLNYLRRKGIRRDSRNGPVLVAPEPVTVTYEKPIERVMFWAARDCNPALHLYESLWMLSGRNDLTSVARYAKQFKAFSDDGKTLHGAYGHRWRRHFGQDQLIPIIERLKKNPDDRRCVLSMWDPTADLDRPGKDVPCNTIATFQRDHHGALDLTVFNRSNDLVWGLTGANGVHFGFLLEYMAAQIGCPIGRYHQITTNLHGYLKTMEPLESITRVEDDPYALKVIPVHMPFNAERLDKEIRRVVARVDWEAGYRWPENPDGYCPKGDMSGWGRSVFLVLLANQAWRDSSKETRFDRATQILDQVPHNDIFDWAVAQREWFQRRETAWRRKNGG
jgi:thymidylate synthase